MKVILAGWFPLSSIFLFIMNTVFFWFVTCGDRQAIARESQSNEAIGTGPNPSHHCRLFGPSPTIPAGPHNQFVLRGKQRLKYESQPHNSSLINFSFCVLSAGLDHLKPQAFPLTRK